MTKRMVKNLTHGRSAQKNLMMDMTVCNRFIYLITVLLKIVLIFGFLYLFICALGFLSNAFKLVGGKAAGKVFRENDILTNPVAGLMIGVLVTVLLQSSSTTTSIIITMVGSEIIPIKTAIPMVMGANIGTSVTNTLVSLAQSSDREVFRKAFGGATVHDMFNWLTVIVLLPIESTVHYLYHLTGVIVRSLELSKSGKKKDLLKVITKPFTGLIVKVDKHVITNIALNKEGAEEDSTLIEKLETEGTRYTLGIMSDSNTSFIKWETNETLVKKINMERCHNLFAQTDLSDSTIGALLLVISLFVIAVALIFMVKLLNSLLKGSVAKVVKKFINSDFPGLFKYLTGYVAILIGTGTTMIIQSSSVFTSILTPLVGVGVVSLDRMLPLTLGANIGTCLTGILAALANPAKAIPNALQVALCHLFFNISGVLLFYPIPITRKAPINLAKGLGNITAKYRWFSILYLILVFIALPGLVFVLSLAGTVPFAVVGSIILLILVCLIVINIAQKYCLDRLPSWLRNWNFLPLCCHSLKPIDKLISSVLGIFVCCRNQEKETDMSGKGCDNKAFTIL
ncbi:SLC34A [Mytilus coruscus]|uniref:SLC34A n=1 Tax=Mytilus coruscus TaxID=42192 RepID=A0A6J8BP72_MYTCO|nr:SLC34A [Mytilus coruscus]